MNDTLISLIACVALFAAVVLCFQLGFRLGRRDSHISSTAVDSVSAITGAIFALLGLIVAFAFSGALARLDTRRQLIVQEANAIGTAYLRLDLLPLEAQAPLRERFQAYAVSRAALYQDLGDDAAVRRDLDTAEALQHEIWDQAMAASRGADFQSARLLLIPALNEMIDIVTTRSVAIQTHMPLFIWFGLSILALVCATIAGYGASVAQHSFHLHSILFAAVVAFTVYMILDIEYPRFGFVRLDQANQALIDLRQTMK